MDNGMADEPREQKTAVTTGANQAQIIDQAVKQPLDYPDSDKRPITGVEVGSQISDPFWAYYTGKILLNPDKTLRTEGINNTELFEDLLRDPQVRSNLETRRLGVIGKEWTVESASEKRQDLKIAEFVTEALKAFDFDGARKSLLQGILTGFKVSEIMWEYSEGDVWIKEMIGKPSRRWSFGLLRELRMLTRANTFEGDPVPDRKFQVFRYTSDNGSPYGDGIGSSLWWPVWFKKNAIKFWLIYSEKFGSPTVVGKYPVGTPASQQDALLAALQAVQQESAIKIPDTMIVELLEAKRAGGMNNYEMLSSFMNAEISKIILGQTLTTEMGKQGGSFAASKTHEEVREDYMKADADLLANQLNAQVVRWLVDYNFGPQQRYPKFWIRTEQEQDLLPLAQRDQIIQLMGMPMTQKYISEAYGIPEPEEGDTLIKAPSGQEKQAINDGRNTATLSMSEGKCRCGHHEFAATQQPGWRQEYMDMITPMLTKLTKQGVGNLGAWMEGQKDVPTLQEFEGNAQRILGDAYAQIDAAPLKEMVQQIYQWHKATDLLAVPKVKIGFGGADVRSVDFLGRLDHFYLAKFVKNQDTEAELLQFLKQHYLEGGEGLFGRGNPAVIAEFRNLLQQKGTTISQDAADRIIDTAVQRIRNWGHVHQLHEMGVETGVIHEPTHECEFCMAIDGHEFSVPVAYARMQAQAAMSGEQYSEWLKNRGQATLDNVQEFMDAGDLPPFHPFCHGYITVLRKQK